MLATVAGYEFDVDRGPDWLWIGVRSLESDSPPAGSFADQLQEVIEKHFVYRVVLDLHRVPELDSELIGQLVQLDRYILSHDGVLRVCGLSEDGRAMMQVCQLDDLCLAYETREEAILGCCGPRLPR